MDNEPSGVGRLLSITLILIIAVGGLALLRFDVMGLRSKLAGVPKEAPNTPPTNSTPAAPGAAETGRPPEPFEPEPPSPDRYRVERPVPLPPTLTVTRKVGQYAADLELVLVPQGWFAMGEDDGVVSNEPKRWVWCSDFYIARTETTNAQFFAFILDNGYSRSQFWTQVGYEFATQNSLSGTEWIGWIPLEKNSKRVRWLSAPGGDVTIELRGADGGVGRTGAPVLVLPENGEWKRDLSYDPVQQKVRLLARDNNWVDADGDDIARSEKLRQGGFLFFTNPEGRLHVEAARFKGSYQVVTWPESNKSPLTGGFVRRDITARITEPRMPAVGMSWFEADACARYWGGRLPWECWWEKAARGDDSRLFPWGNELNLNQRAPGGVRITTGHANFNRGLVMPVGSFPAGASPYGVLDMVGNVSEWTADAYVSNLLRQPTFDGPDPHYAGGPRDQRSERGTNTDDGDTQVARVYNRRSSNPFLSTLPVRGFRIAYTAEEALRAAGR